MRKNTTKKAAPNLRYDRKRSDSISRPRQERGSVSFPFLDPLVARKGKINLKIYVADDQLPHGPLVGGDSLLRMKKGAKRFAIVP